LLFTECRTTYEDLREETREFVAVPVNAMGFVIGKRGNTIKEIQEKTGTRISKTGNKATQSGFHVCGNKDQRAQAREMINQKVVRDSERTLISLCHFPCHQNY